MEHQPVSMVESEREEELRIAREREAAAKALAEKQYKAELFKKRTQKILLISSMTILAGALIFAAIWLISTIISNTPNPSSPSEGDNSQDEPPVAGDLAVIEGYKCTSNNCSKIVELSDHSLLVRDNSAYYIHDRSTGVSARTTIQEQIYREIIPFTWGSELLVVLHPDTGRSAIYSITRNRQIGNFNYDSFITNIADPAYEGMTWLAGQYIIAKQGNETRLLSIFDGSEVVRATSKVFAYKPYFFGYETTGERRVYLDNSTRILSTTAGDYLGVKDSYLIHIKAKSKTSVDIYDQNGSKIKTSEQFYKDLLKRLRDTKSKDYPAVLAGFADVYTVKN